MLHITPFLTAYSTLLSFMLGTVMASFLGCMGWRMCNGESVARGRSHCDSCGHVLGGRDLIPILSYLLSKGRCRYCGAKIPKINLFGELGMGVLFALFTLLNGNLYDVVLYLFFFCILYLVTVTDLTDQIIPDSAILVAILVRVTLFVLDYYYDLSCLFSGDFCNHVIDVEKPALWSGLLGLLIDGLAISLPLLILVLIMERILQKEAMGGGDIKLIFVTGLYLGWAKNLMVILFACIIGIVVGTIQQKKAAELQAPEGHPTGEPTEQSLEQQSTEPQPLYFAFGPSISAAAVLVALVGDVILQWYMSLF